MGSPRYGQTMIVNEYRTLDIDMEITQNESYKLESYLVFTIELIYFQPLRCGNL